MKAKTFIIMAICFIVSMSTFAVTTVTIGNLKYELNGTDAYVSGYVGSPTDVVIPATIESDGLTFRVTKIKASAFKNCTSITSVKAEGYNLAVIGHSGNIDGAFEGCTSLLSASFPNVQTIYLRTFSNCSKLQHVWLGYNLKIIGYNSGDGAFYNCSMLSYIVLPACCTSILKYGSSQE